MAAAMSIRTQLGVALVLTAVAIGAAIFAGRTREGTAVAIERAGDVAIVDSTRADVELAAPTAVDDEPAAAIEPRRTAAVASRPKSAEKRREDAESRERIRVPLQVTVVDELGAPVADARVLGRITRDPPFGLRESRATTDEHGRATLEAQGCISAKLTVRPDPDDRAHEHVEELVASCFDRVVVTLPMRHWLHVDAVDREGKPVASIERMTLESPSRSGLPREANESSATGEYEIDVGVEAGVVTLSSMRCGTAMLAYDPSRPSTMRARVVLERAAGLRVRTLRDGAAAANVRVALGAAYPRDCGRLEQLVYGPRIGSRGGHTFAEQTSDSDGRVEFAIEETREYVVLAESLAVGTGSAAVSVAVPGRDVEVDVELGKGLALDMIAVDAKHAPVPLALVQLFGPAGTRRLATADAQGRCRTVAMPPGSWDLSASPSGRYGGTRWREAIVVEVDGKESERVEVPTEPRARLAVAGDPRFVELYAAGCPPIRIETRTPADPRAGPFESDHVGRHVVVFRERRYGRDEVVRIVEVDLVEGDNELEVDIAPRDAKLELDAGLGWNGAHHWLRTSSRAGATEFHAIKKGSFDRGGKSAGKRSSWVADVPAGNGELVYVAPTSGEVEVVAGDLSFASGEARRVVLEAKSK